MSKYIYPAIFTQENDGGYSITFPDIENCYTQGDDLQDGYDMANDILCLTLYRIEEKGFEIPEPSNPKSVQADSNSFVTLISADTMEYRKFYENKSVKKTLTIPQWLNTMAEREDINFSQVLQEALRERLKV